MPIEIRRFGVGHRRPDGPAGSVGLTGQVIHSDGRGTVSELAFARGARIEPHANPNTTLFIVVEGGGWVGVGEERTRIAAGEAAVWPADLIHSAWTEHSEMRALVVEFQGPDDRDIVAGVARRTALEDGDEGPVERGTGELVPSGPAHADPRDGEPV
jgi:quercetin dioxygenase-like cupin family protein